MSTPTVPTGLLIGGEWLQTDSRLAVMDPAAESVLAEIGDASVADGLDAVAAAHEAFGSWSLTAARQRAEILRKAFEIMTAELETCARLISLENGKATRDALGEAAYAAEFFRWFSEEASRIEGDFRYSPSRRQDDHHRPSSDRGGLHDHAVELPGGDGHPQARAGVGGGVHGDPQAGVGDSVDGVVDR